MYGLIVVQIEFNYQSDKSIPLLFSILDDVELFELGKSFTVDELCSMGTFFNQLVYETVLAVPDRKLNATGSLIHRYFINSCSFRTRSNEPALYIRDNSREDHRKNVRAIIH